MDPLNVVAIYKEVVTMLNADLLYTDVFTLVSYWELHDLPSTSITNSSNHFR
jgi:hypothetical protein